MEKKKKTSKCSILARSPEPRMGWCIPYWRPECQSGWKSGKILGNYRNERGYIILSCWTWEYPKNWMLWTSLSYIIDIHKWSKSAGASVSISAWKPWQAARGKPDDKLPQIQPQTVFFFVKKKQLLEKPESILNIGDIQPILTNINH